MLSAMQAQLESVLLLPMVLPLLGPYCLEVLKLLPHLVLLYFPTSSWEKQQGIKGGDSSGCRREHQMFIERNWEGSDGCQAKQNLQITKTN